MGTLDFIAPEQIRGDEVDARADIYALGSVLFYLLTAEVPFPRDSDEAKMWAQLTEPPPGIDSPLNPVIQRAIAKSPDDRFQSAGDLGRAAQAAVAGISVTEPERAVARGAAAPVGQRTVTRRVPMAPARRRWTAGAAATLAVAGVAIAVAIMRPTSDRDAAVRATPTPTRTPTEPAAQRPRVVATVRWGRRPNSLVPAGDRVWAGAWHSDRVAAIDASATSVLGRTSHLAPGGTADLVRTKDTLWVLTRAWQLLRLDVRSGRPLAPSIGLSMKPTAVAVHGHDVWVAEQTDAGTAGQIVRLDARTGALKLAAAAAPGVVGMVYARGRLWSLHAGPNNLVARDAATMQPIKNVPLPGTGVGGLAAGAGALWVTIPDYDQLVRYTLRTGKRITVSIIGRPIGVAVNGPDVWVAASGSSAIQHVGAHSARLIGRPVRVPLNPLAIAISPHGVWVTCVGRNLIARVAVPS